LRKLPKQSVGFAKELADFLREIRDVLSVHEIGDYAVQLNAQSGSAHFNATLFGLSHRRRAGLLMRAVRVAEEPDSIAAALSAKIR
jgi:hypothetical protein